MPPKGADGAAKAQKKAEQAAKQRKAEDKTFGLKNKNKSVKVQQCVPGRMTLSRPEKSKL